MLNPYICEDELQIVEEGRRTGKLELARRVEGDADKDERSVIMTWNTSSSLTAHRPLFTSSFVIQGIVNAFIHVRMRALFLGGITFVIPSHFRDNTCHFSH